MSEEQWLATGHVSMQAWEEAEWIREWAEERLAMQLFREGAVASGAVEWRRETFGEGEDAFEVMYGTLRGRRA